MKAITICQPFAELIARGEKLVENRKWRTNYRGPLAIHAGLSTKWLGVWPAISRDEARELPRGFIVATCEVVGCLPLEEVPAEYYPHAFGPFCWILQNVQRLAAPIPCKGKLSLWNPSQELLSQLSR